MNKVCKVMLQKTNQTCKCMKAMRKISKTNKCRAFNKAVGPGKKYKINKLINVGPTFILDYRIPSNMIFLSLALLPRNNHK